MLRLGRWRRGAAAAGAGSALSRRLARAAARAGHMAPRHLRRRQRGQTLVIFALTFTTLISILGLAIDSVRVYDLYARMQRAAEAGALASVIYMPNFYSADLPYAPNDSGICRALQEIAKNGFGPSCNPVTTPISAAAACPADVTTVEIAVCPVAGKPYDVHVYITETLNVVFLSAIGVGPVRLTANAQAEYLPPVSLGTDTTASSGGAGNWGGLGICKSYVYPVVPIDCDDTLRSFAANIAGPAELKQQGDAFVYCQEGPSYTGAPDPSAQFGYPYTTFNGFPTNHPQYADAGLSSSHCGSGNPDQQPFTGPATQGTAHPGGYAFYIHVVQAGSSVWLWNAPFGPSDTGPGGTRDCTNEYPLDAFHWTCSGNTPVTPAGYFPGSNYATLGFKDPSLYFTTTFSIYTVPDVANPAGGTLLGRFNALPYNTMSTNGCTTSKAYEMASSAYPGTVNGCVTSKCHYQWCPLGNQTGDLTVPAAISLPAGDYRVMAESSSYTNPTDFQLGWGQHIYNLQVCPPGTTQSTAPNCITTPASPPGYVGGWGDVSMLFDNTVEVDNCNPPCIGNSYAPGLAEFPLGIVPTEYAGLTLDVKLFNPGNIWPAQASSGSDAIAVIPPLAGVGGTTGVDPCSIAPSLLSAYTYSFPPWERSGTAQTVVSTAPALPALIAVQNSDRLYTGLWTDTYVQLPTNYTAGQWTLCTWATANLNSSDDPYSQQVMTIKVTALGQSPVHLVG